MDNWTFDYFVDTRHKTSSHLRSGGSVGSIVVVGCTVVGAIVVTGLASGGNKLQSPSRYRNSMSSRATYPLALFVRVTMNLN